MKILVTGGTGFVGRHLVNALADRNHEVYCLVRDEQKAREILNSKVELVKGDLTSNLRFCEKRLLSAEAVFHLAACVNSRRVKDFYEVNWKGTEQLVDILKYSTALKKLIYLSSLAVIGRTQASMTEDTPCRPFSPYGRSKLLAEASVSRIDPGSLSAQVLIVRAPVVYGEGQPELVSDFFKTVRSGKLTLLGDGQVKRSMCYIHNLIFVLCELLHVDVASQKSAIINVCDGETRSLLDVAKTISKTFGRKEMKIKTYSAYLASLAAFIYQCLTFVGYNSVRLFALTTATANIDCDTRKLKRMICSELPYSFDIGISRTAKWMDKEIPTEAA